MTPAAPKSQEKPIVFVVDDDISVRESLELLIDSAGLEARTFASAHEFLSHPKATRPKCLVLDVGLPDLNGLDLQKLVADRRQHPADDLLSGLIHVEESGDRLSESELFSMLSLLIVAGHETTVSLIGNTVLALLQNPDVHQELLHNRELIPAAMEEFLRYDAPVERTVTRIVREDIELGGQQLKRGDLIIAILGSANRDEMQFESATALDIHRRQNTHIAFGKGIHYCLGAPLARLEGEIALHVLLDRLPDLKLDISIDELEWRDVPLFHSLVHLPVKWASS
jgi:cytochrome P450